MLAIVAIAWITQIPDVAEERARTTMPVLEECRLEGATRVDRMSALPAAVSGALRGVIGNGLADAGEPFNASDVVTSDPPVPQRRFLRAYHHGGRWIVWYEHGGIGYHLHAIGLIQRKGRAAPEPYPWANYGGGTATALCAGSRAFFDGAQTSNHC